MKKSFPLSVPGKNPPRVVEAIKNDVRKYVKRERRKPLPEGTDFWDFDCRVGKDDTPPEPKHVDDVIGAIDTTVALGATSIYIEILAKPGLRKKKED